jgi:hypothetical protein
MTKVKIYSLIDPRTGKPFYVGATQSELKARLSHHVAHAKGDLCTKKLKRRMELIRSILAEGMRPKICLLEVVALSAAGECERKHFMRLKKAGFDMIQGDGNFGYNKFIDTREKTKLWLDGNGKVNLITKAYILNKAAKKANNEGVPLSTKIDELIREYIEETPIVLPELNHSNSNNTPF